MEKKMVTVRMGVDLWDKFKDQLNQGDRFLQDVLEEMVEGYVYSAGGRIAFLSTGNEGNQVVTKNGGEWAYLRTNIRGFEELEGYPAGGGGAFSLSGFEEKQEVRVLGGGKCPGGSSLGLHPEKCVCGVRARRRGKRRKGRG